MASRPEGLKVIVGGPCQTGKTVLSNFLSENASHLNFPDRYEKTVGCRVLEFESGGGGGGWGGAQAIELWDCSGDEKYENCYPAITQDAAGAILVFNPDDRGQASMIHKWYDWFVTSAGLQPEHCLLVALRSSKAAINKPVMPRQVPERVRFVAATFDDQDVLRREFDRFSKGLERRS